MVSHTVTESPKTGLMSGAELAAIFDSQSPPGVSGINHVLLFVVLPSNGVCGYDTVSFRDDNRCVLPFCPTHLVNLLDTT